MISVEEARARILASVTPLPGEVVPVTQALGRVLAMPARARRTQPWADISAMDGYAVRCSDVSSVPATLRPDGESRAGGVSGPALEAGTCRRIFTGAPVPEGADAIVIQEDTDSTPEGVVIRELPVAGRHIRRAGNDFTEGDVLFEADHLVRARDVGLLAAMNLPWVTVHRRPRVAILSTGDEIVMPGEPLGPSQIVSANGPALSALVLALGGEPVHLGIAGDDRGALGRMLDGARGTDLLLTTGGASVGDHDLVQDALVTAGMELDFWRIAMRPGKPLMHGRLHDLPVLGLPGNPVSSQVCAMLFAVPLLKALQGLAPTLPVAQARLGAALGRNDRREDYIRATLEDGEEDGVPVARPLPVQDSAQLAAFSRADALIIRPPFDEAKSVGDRTEILRFATGHLGL